MSLSKKEGGYRDKIYEKYTSIMAKSGSLYDNEKNISRMKQSYNTYLKGWLPKKREAYVLDLGCGWGLLLDFFKGKGYPNIYGTDISSEQLQSAKKITENVFEIDNLFFLKEHSNFFDLIIGVDIIEHYRKDEVLEFLNGCYDALKSGGRLVLQTPNAESPWGMSCYCGDLTHETAFTPIGISRILAHTGFEDIDVREAGPACHGIRSFIRAFFWKLIWGFLAFWNIIETGNKGSGIYTRVFFVSAIKGDIKK